jgi:hypothetical protein
MPATVNDLDFWSDDIKVEVLTPLMILRAQEPALRKKTKGILQAEVETVSTDSSVIHNLYLVAPALGNYKEKILSVTHTPSLVYPCEVASSTLSGVRHVAVVPSLSETIYSQTGFIDRLRDALQSPFVRSTIDSLLAKSNEQRTEKSNPTVAPQSGDLS